MEVTSILYCRLSLKDLTDDFETIPLFSSRLQFIVHSSHPLAGLSSITLKRLSETPLILPERGFATRKKIEELCRKHQLELTVGVEMDDVHTIIHALKSGQWATILTQAAVRGEAGLVQIPILCNDHLTSRGFLFWPLKEATGKNQHRLLLIFCLK